MDWMEADFHIRRRSLVFEILAVQPDDLTERLNPSSIKKALKERLVKANLLINKGS